MFCLAMIASVFSSTRATAKDGKGSDEIGHRVAMAGPGELIFFGNQQEFEDFNVGEGKILKGLEDYEASNLPPNAVAVMDDSLQFGVPCGPPGCPYPNGTDGLPNLTTQSNVSQTQGQPPDSPSPRGSSGLAPASAGFLGVVSDVVVTNFFPDSLDLIFEAGDEPKTGVGFDTISGPASPSVFIRVYSTEDVLLGEATNVPADAAGNNFFGVWSSIPIGRINIYDDSGNGPEGADNIQAWISGGPVCQADLNDDGVVGAADLAQLLASWGPCADCDNCPADFNEDCEVGAADLASLLASWGPCL